ncbi:HlyD family secretion protein [Govanella unica]|uniref:HlyD family secretion protein n=1 Tax=Govanella unica TaxID=2975056 RepID=A0A9X3Z7Y5_9PROT|nr:HlyD family secretion protein [Govania unica]MDA5194760.1 HlyD family secretion protein [Govania unica]
MTSAQKSMLRLGAAGLLLVAALVFGWHWWTVSRYIETTDNAYVEADMSIIAPKVTGYVREVRVAHNQPVHTGDVLVVIDDRDFTAHVQAADANVAARRAASAALVEQVTLQHSLIHEAEARLRSTEAERKRAKSDLDRYISLASDGTVSRQRRDQAEADHEKADAALTANKAALAAERQRLVVFSSQIEESAAALKAAEAERTLAQIDLDNTIIRAPIDGVVGNKQVEIGQYLRPGMQILAVVPLPDVHVVANFKETQVAYMKIGQPVTLKIDAFKDREVKGTVESFAPASGARFSLLPPENATGNFTKIVQRVPVRIKVSSADLAGALRPGLSAVVSVDTRSNTDNPAGQGLAAAAAETPRAAALPAPTSRSAP